MSTSFLERASTPLFSKINLEWLQEPHTEIGLWHTNEKLFFDFTTRLNTLDKAQAISELKLIIFDRPCKEFPKWLIHENEQSVILETLCAWAMCCAVYNFLYSRTDRLKKPD